MSTADQQRRAHNASQTARNARTLAAFMALANEDIARRLRELRAEMGNPPQKTVAAAMGVGHRTYQTWESAEARPNWRGLTLAAAYYRVTVEYILDGTSAGVAPEQEATQLDRIEAMLVEILTRMPGPAEAGTAPPLPEPPLADRPAKRPAHRPSRAS